MQNNTPTFLQRLAGFGDVLRETQITDVSGQGLALEAGLDQCVAMLRQTRELQKRVYVIGNGGSAAVAAHIVNDFVNTGKLKASVIHDAALLTCMTNDYGYENAYARILGTFVEAGDVLVAISSSGNSANIRNGVSLVRERGAKAITLSGFKSDNPLRSLGDVNLWLDSELYGPVEIGHLFLLHCLADNLALTKA